MPIDWLGINREDRSCGSMGSVAHRREHGYMTYKYTDGERDGHNGFLDRRCAARLTETSIRSRTKTHTRLKSSSKSPFNCRCYAFVFGDEEHVETHGGFDFGEHTRKRIDYVVLAPRYSSPWDVKGAIILETLRRWYRK